MQTDPIADCFTRLRNGAKARQEFVEIPYSKMKEQILALLNREGFISHITVTEEAPKPKSLRVRMKFTGADGESTLEHIRRISKPGHRKYTRTPGVSKVRGGMGFQILTTSQGIMTDRQATEKKVGGEVIGEVY